MRETPQGVFMSNYTITLTDDEIATLGWAVNRGYFPDETYKHMHLADGQPEEVFRDEERQWNIPEYAAWAILQQRDEDPYSLYSCLSGKLLEKLITLEQSIV